MVINSKVLYTFVPNKSFCQLLDTSSENFIFLKTLTQNFHMLTYCLLIKILNRLRQKINITLVINESVKYKKWRDIQFSIERIFIDGFGFLPFAKNMGANIVKNVSKSFNGKYSQKLFG